MHVKPGQSQGPEELFGTIVTSLHNYLLIRQVKPAAEQELEYLVFLGTHAVMQTVGEWIFGLRGIEGTRFYLEHFVDVPTPEDKRFSSIVSDIHDLRNIHAHQWFSAHLHQIAFDYRISEGWKLEGQKLHINPRLYASQFIERFPSVYDFSRHTTAQNLRVQFYHFLMRWLDLSGDDPIRRDVKALVNAPDFEAQTRSIDSTIRQRYGLR